MDIVVVAAVEIGTAVAGMFAEGRMAEERGHRRRSMIALHRHRWLRRRTVSVDGLLVAEEDNRWRSIGLDIGVGRCDSLGEGRKVAFLWKYM